MKSLVNAIIIFSAGYAAYLQIPYFHGWFGAMFMLSRDATSYWGWFDWLTVLDWVPRLLMGFVTGLCAAVLCRGDNPHFWALSCGILLMAASVLTADGVLTIDIPPKQKIFQSLWPLIYPVGSFLGAVFFVAARRFVTVNDD